MLRNLYYKVWSIIDYVSSKVKINDDSEVISHKNLPYGNDIIHHNFDIHYPKHRQGEKLPAIFVIHGGGYVAGKKEGTTKFCQELSKRGFVVFNLEYTPSGKEKKYFPTPVYEFYDFYKFMTEKTDIGDLIDYNNLFVAGDSAGAHIASLIANIQTNPILKEEFGVKGGPPIKGSIFICPSFGVYNFKGLFLKKEYHDVVFGPKKQRDPLSEYTHALEMTTDTFPPSIVISAKGDYVVGAHKNRFLKMAKELGLSVQHYDVCSGHKLFHCSMIEHADKYPICIDKITRFINDAKGNIFTEGVYTDRIFEEIPENIKKLDDPNNNKDCTM